MNDILLNINNHCAFEHFMEFVHYKCPIIIIIIIIII